MVPSAKLKLLAEAQLNLEQDESCKKNKHKTNLFSTFNLFISSWRVEEPHLFTCSSIEPEKGRAHLVVDEDGGVVGPVGHPGNEDPGHIFLPTLVG